MMDAWGGGMIRGLALHPTKTRFVDFRFRRPGTFR